MTRECPDCKAQLRDVKLIDATAHDLLMEGCQHVDLTYAALDSDKSLFFGKVPALGRVRAKLCPECGRMLLYAESTEALGLEREGHS